MARVLITGSTTGLGLLAARQLWAGGHEAVLHARNEERADDVRAAVDRPDPTVVVGDLGMLHEVATLAEGIAALGHLDAVVHNAGVLSGPGRGEHPSTVATVNVLAPYLVTALAPTPPRIVLLGSGMHRGGAVAPEALLEDARGGRATTYSESKFHLTVLGLALARAWPAVLTNVVDPGWVPTRMGGSSAPDDLDLGARTQVWLATSDDPDATVTGAHLHHQRRRDPHPATTSEQTQQRLLAVCAQLTGVDLPHDPVPAAG